MNPGIPEEIQKARENEADMNLLIEKNKKFIITSAWKTVNHYVTESDDEWSVALIAFHEAVLSYEEEKGNFHSFAALVIRRRLLDYLRTEARHAGEIAVELAVLSGDISSEEDMSPLELEIKKREVALSEELEYAHAYRLIIQSRFGERLICTEDIDQGLLDVQVPRLVIQPIMENAVEHGTRQDGTCSVRLVIKGEKDDLSIEVWNLGVPSARDWERIHQLLDVPDEAGDFHSVEIGIRNVNRRVRMMYGEGSGLSFREEEGWTVSRVRVVRKKEDRS